MTNQALLQLNLALSSLDPSFVSEKEPKISDDVEGNWWSGLVKGLYVIRGRLSGLGRIRLGITAIIVVVSCHRHYRLW